MNEYIKEYFGEIYGENITINDFKDDNYCFDVFLHDRNVNFSVEIKQRYFETGKTDRFLKEFDILIELIQSTPFVKQLDISNVNNNKAYDINIAVGWFYKCYAKRLVFFRYLDSVIYDVIDIDFELFKCWFMNNINDFKLQYSAKTTGTINAVVKLSDIPKGYLIYKKYKGE
jgi:hypothetical protein